MITNYLRYKKQENRKSRYNLTAYSEPLYSNENFNPALKPFLYGGNNPNIKSKSERKSDYQLSWNGKNLSSLFSIDLKIPEFSYGDFNLTEDFVLFSKSNDNLEMFIFKEYRNLKNLILDMLLDGELTREIEIFREKAVPFLPGLAKAEI